MFKRFLVFVLVAGLVFPYSAFSAVIGEFAVVTGDVTVTREGQTLKPKVKDNIQTGDFIATGKNSNARIVLTDATAMAIGPNSKMEMKQFTVQDGKTTGLFSLHAGLVQTNIGKALNPGSKFEIHTPNAIVGAKGTAWLTLVELAVQSVPQSSFYSLSQSIIVASTAFPAQAATVVAGNFTVVAGAHFPTAVGAFLSPTLAGLTAQLGASAIPGIAAAGAAGAAGAGAGFGAAGAGAAGAAAGSLTLAGMGVGTLSIGALAVAGLVAGVLSATGGNRSTPTHTTPAHHQ